MWYIANKPKTDEEKLELLKEVLEIFEEEYIVQSEYQELILKELWKIKDEIIEGIKEYNK